MVYVFLGISSGLFLLGLIAVAVLAVRVSQGPLEVDMLRDKIIDTLQASVPPSIKATIGKTFLVRNERGPTVRIEQFVLKDSQNRTLIAAPSADVNVNTLDLLRGRLSVSGLEFTGLDVRMAILPGGTVAVSAGDGESIEIAPQDGVQGKFGAAELTAALFTTAAADKPIFGDIKRISLTDARLVLDDRRSGVSSTYSKVNFVVDRSASGGVNVRLGAAGQGGPFSLSLLARQGAASDAKSGHVLDFVAADIPVSELLAPFGLSKMPFDALAPVSAKGTFNIDANGTLAGAQGKFALGAGILKIDDPDAEPILLDELTTDFAYDAAQKHADLTNLELFAGLTHLKLTGKIDLTPEPNSEIRIKLAGDHAVFAGDTGSDKTVSVDTLTFDATVKPGEQSFRINQLTLKGPDLDSTISLAVRNTDTGPAVSGTIAITKTRLRSIFHLWPGFTAFEVRKWMVAHVTSGFAEKATLTFDLDAAAFADARKKLPIPDTSLTADVTVSNGVLAALPGMPPLSNIDGSGHFTGTTAAFNAARATLDLSPRKLNFTDIKLSIPDHRPKLFNATLTGHTQSTLDAAVDLLSRDALKKYNNVPGEPAQYKGQLEGQVEIAFKIGKTATPDDVSVKTNLTASNVSVEKVVDTEKLDNANLTIVTTKTSLLVKGDGRMFNAPVSIELKKNGSAPTDASLTFVLDDAARAKRGIETGPGFSGPVSAKVTTQLSDGDRPKADLPKGETRATVELDLTRANIDGFLPGWLKAAGKSGKATFVATKRADSIQLDQFQLDAGNASFRGAVTLDTEGGFESAKFSSFRLSTADELKLDVQKDGNLFKLSGSAASIDARPYITDLLAHSRAKAANGQDFDLELKANNIIGFNKERVEGVDVKLKRRGGVLQKVQLNSRLSGGALKIVSKDSETIGGYVITAENAGALLAFLDVYRRMEGGSMTLNIHPQPERLTGGVMIRDFYLNDEPALRSLVSSNDANAQISPTHVNFKRLQGAFVRTDGRIDITDAAMSGQQVGATLGGMIDYGKDRVDLAGNLIPAYEINNFFAKIPIVGPILGGGKNEGLFAINFRIVGKASAPTLRVDPLSAVAPGIFRKILGVADGTANNPDNFIVDVPESAPAENPQSAVPQDTAPLQLGKPKK